jgi:hypothetical protein
MVDVVVSPAMTGAGVDADRVKLALAGGSGVAEISLDGVLDAVPLTAST